MKKKTLALFDSNLNYMEKLYRYLEDCRKIKLSICAFTDEEKLIEYMDREKIDYLIASEDKKTDFSRVGQLIYIHENFQNEGIYRYTPADGVVDRLTKIIGLDINEGEFSNTDSKVIGVFSPVGRTMKTSFCTVLGQMLAKKNRVLYLNFESFSGMCSAWNAPRNGDMTDILYYFNNIRSEFVNKFRESLNNYNGLDMIKPAFYYIDLAYITPDVWDDFLNEIIGMNEYDYIILDLSEYLQGLFDSFLSRCFVIYTLTANDSRAQSKIFHYEQMLNEYKYDEILSKTKKISIPVIRNLPGEIDRLLYTELGDYVRKATMGEFDW